MISDIIYYIYIGTMGISAIMAVLYWRALSKLGLMVLTFYLPLVLAQEVTLYVLDKLSKDYFSTGIVYNLYRVITVLVFAFIYFKVPFLASSRKLIAWITGGYLLMVVANYVFVESIFSTGSYVALLRGFVMTTLALIFLFSYFNLDKRAEEKHWMPLLWITIGLVTFYPVVSISLAFQKFLAEVEATLYGMKLYHVIPRLMSIFMYGCFSYAFYLCRKKN